MHLNETFECAQKKHQAMEALNVAQFYTLIFQHDRNQWDTAISQV
jgi:hypothetical protein